MATLLEKLEALREKDPPTCCMTCARLTALDEAIQLVTHELGKHRFDATTEWVGVTPHDVPHE
jgi:hypothetical protein